jgi:hypothetical protein
MRPIDRSACCPRLFLSPVDERYFPVDFEMFIVDKKQNQSAIANVAFANSGR